MLVKLSKEHSHPEERRDKVARTARLAMKAAAARRPDKSIKKLNDEVYSEIVRELDDPNDRGEVAAAIAGFEWSRSAIQRTRAKEHPPFPDTLD